MNTSEEIKSLVRDKYAQIALQDPTFNAASCCGAGTCATIDYSIFAADYTGLEGYLESADLKLGCGMPVEHARIAPGNTVVDLGSGAGNDAFIARALVGPQGQVIGVDMTPQMINKATENAERLGLTNVKFRLGEIEDLPMAANKADVIISNCVLNLVPDKEKAFAEIYRVLKAGGHFCISDVVLKGDLPEEIRKAGEMYAGCVSGALQKRDYMGIIHDQGFQAVSIKEEKVIELPDEILADYLHPEGIKAFRSSGLGIYSITVYAEKPLDSACCAPGAGCC